jgi:hypothetical protein
MPSAVVVDNVFEAAVLSASQTEDAVYPLANLVDRVAAVTYRMGAASGWVEADLGEETPLDTVGVVNHLLTEAATVQIYAGATSPAGTLVAEPDWAETNIWAHVGSISPRYVRLVFSDPANPAAWGVEFGQLVGGVREVLPLSRRWGMGRETDRRDIVHETVDGVVWAYRRTEEPIRRYSWRLMIGDMETFETLDKRLSGRVRPFLWIEDTAKVGAMYARLLRSNFEAREIPDAGLEAYDLDWEIRAESRGSEVLA